MKYYIRYIIIALTLGSNAVLGQLVISPDTIICSATPVSLEVLSAPSYGTDSYTVTSIPFSSETHAGSNAFPTGLDDISTGSIDLGFDFCFFGNTYDHCYISTNGWVTFTSPPSAWNSVYGPGGTPTYNIPNTNTNVPKNCIMGPWQDWYPASTPTVCKYQTLGTAPFRRFVVSYQDIQLFWCYASAKGSFQIVLYETTNVIENHIIYKDNCTGWENGKATQAIHNSDGTVSYEVSGRDATSWTTTDESWAYIPSGVEWYVGGTLIGTGDSISVSPLVTTTYTAQLLACDGTTYSEDVTVSVSSPDDASFTYPSGPSYCLDGTTLSPDFIALAGGTFSASPAGMDIDPSTGNIDLGSSSSGSYVVEYLTNGLCPDSSTLLITLLDYDDATFSYAASTFCPIGTAATTYVATAGGTFSVSPSGLSVNSSTGSIDLTSGSTGVTYTITYTTSGACPSSSSLTIEIEPFEDASFSYDAASYCPTGTTIPTITGTTGGTFTIIPATISLDPITGELDLSTGDVGTTYSITYTTSGFCSDALTVTVTIDPLDDASFSYDASSYCPTGTTTPDLITIPGGTFSISPTDITIDFLTGEIDLTSGTIGTTYAITYTTPAGPCQNSSTETVTIDPLDDPAFNYSSDSYCPEGFAVPTFVATAGGSYSISPTSMTINSSTGSLDLSTGVEGTTYTITYITPVGPCQNSSFETVTILPVTDANFSYDDTIYCQDGLITPSIDYPGGVFTAEPGISINSLTGEINLEASSSGGPYEIYYASPGCGETDTVQITINPLPTLSLNTDPHVCIEGEQVEILYSPTGGIVSGTGVSGNFFDPSLVSEAGTYTISYSYTDAIGCTNTIYTSIEVKQNNVDAGPDVSIYEAQEITLHATGGATYTWEPPDGLSCTGCPNPIAAPAQTTTYLVSSYDEFGCFGTDDITVTVIPVFDSTVFVPNTFTPNNDLLNDYLFVYGSDIAVIKSFFVFDRWGEILWQKSDIFPDDESQGWDGSTKGLLLSTGVYTYLVEVELVNGASILKKGNVTLIR